MSAALSALWFVDDPEPAAVLRGCVPERDTAQALLTRLYPERGSVPLGRVSLRQATTSSGDDTVFVGCFPGVTVVCTADLAFRRPSLLPDPTLHTLACEDTYLIVSDAPGAWGAFGAWHRGTPRRAFGAGAVEFFEDDGLPFAWERPFWSGEHPIRWPAGVPPHPQSLPFHPRRLVDAANAAWLGFRFVGCPDDEPRPDDIEVWAFALRDPAPDPHPATPARRRRTRAHFL
ncbi:DUF6928 family protein [Rhodococcus yananensis]|uniref:DUF6928 family protein n=1 Tax=Rhodococcus yananensis TaxID=2879464 RepID=UPI003EBE2841